MTPALPFLPPSYRVGATRGKVMLESGQRLVCLEGRAADRLVPALLPLLDGTRTVDEIVRMLGESARPAIESALTQFTTHGLLVEGPPLGPDVPRPVSGAVQLLASLHPGAAQLSETAASVVDCSVAVVGDSAVGVEVARLLRLSGVDVERSERVATTVDLTVCAPAPAELPLLRTWNKGALEVRAPWLQVLPFDG